MFNPNNVRNALFVSNNAGAKAAVIDWTGCGRTHAHQEVVMFLKENGYTIEQVDNHLGYLTARKDGVMSFFDYDANPKDREIVILEDM
ncbi:hypothetical protein AsFcp4_258 [Aeromonas phage AsFcp_4]|uniref:Uncharacterized protein n=1 Tax=Aeromonas phage PX29 TaxID=926067 RepID=E5DQ35_9CAUD|nr:hypothetical protein CL89_gp102 [Aeromonas phage PX29]ADQ52821.1 conserved hypothetical protein [Aeromonas phage PX29]QAX98367.1 hypothetical protein ASfcp2_21 [Aeromonas phage AsFcp_2]QAX99710.1 hypothetical protein AsFcp4_258 [Aeromonas phage AsFcp_4]